MTAVVTLSALARESQRLRRPDALALVDRVLGEPDEWQSALVRYRLTSEFQADWKVEFGQWLGAAEQFGFLEKVRHEIMHQAQRKLRNPPLERDGNDPAHLKLHQHMAAARIVHYLTATGWTFDGYETDTGASVDVDCRLRTPSGDVVEFQVKAPDQPGQLATRPVSNV